MMNWFFGAGSEEEDASASSHPTPAYSDHPKSPTPMLSDESTGSKCVCDFFLTVFISFWILTCLHVFTCVFAHVHTSRVPTIPCQVPGLHQVFGFAVHFSKSNRHGFAVAAEDRETCCTEQRQGIRRILGASALQLVHGVQSGPV